MRVTGQAAKPTITVTALFFRGLLHRVHGSSIRIVRLTSTSTVGRNNGAHKRLIARILVKRSIRIILVANNP